MNFTLTTILSWSYFSSTTILLLTTITTWLLHFLTLTTQTPTFTPLILSFQNFMYFIHQTYCKNIYNFQQKDVYIKYFTKILFTYIREIRVLLNLMLRYQICELRYQNNTDDTAT